MRDVIDQLQGYLKGMGAAPKWIEDIPGARSPYWEVIEVTFSASSTAKREGVATVSADGPFVCTGLALFFKKTSGAYDGVWGPATAFDARIASVGQQHGFEYLFDQPHCSSFTFEVTDQGSDRMWQSKPVASALFSPQAGGAYVLPFSHLFKRNSTIKLGLTPDVSMPYTATVQGIFLGYKIVQGAVAQP